MDTLQIAYKILYSLEHEEKADYMGQVISPAALKIPEEDWLRVLQALLDEGYISGAKIGKDILGNPLINIKNTRITMKGAEYLKENHTMRRLAGFATDIISIVKP